MKPALLILAAGMGSRYGGLKQLDGFGPAGETILEYSVYDALRAGFGRVVFVIRRDFAAAFKKQVASRFSTRADIGYVYQELKDGLPPRFKAPPERAKPWGTGHAVLCARGEIQEPFGVINADDFYGAVSYTALFNFLSKAKDGRPPARFCLVGFRLGNTLSEHGTVARGICTVNTKGSLQNIVERPRIEKTPGGARYFDEEDVPHSVPLETVVSMNFWGFTPALFPLLERRFRLFLKEHGENPKAEFYLPDAAGAMILEDQARIAVMPTPEQWFGVTYPGDKDTCRRELAARHHSGLYPSPLWSEPDASTAETRRREM